MKIGEIESWKEPGVNDLGKQEDVMAEFSRARLNEEAVSVERVHFYKTDKKVNPKQEEPFWFSAGKLPVLVSAPHAVRHYRQKKIRMSDEFTGSIVYLSPYGEKTPTSTGGERNHWFRAFMTESPSPKDFPNSCSPSALSVVK